MIELKRFNLLNSDERKLFDYMFTAYLTEVCDKDELSRELDDMHNDELNRQMIEQTLRKHDPYFIMRILSDNRHAGFISYFYIETKRLGFINNFYIVPEQRKQGLGMTAYKKAEAHLVALGASAIECNPIENALQFYIKNGFTPTRTTADGEVIYRKSVN